MKSVWTMPEEVSEYLLSVTSRKAIAEASGLNPSTVKRAFVGQKFSRHTAEKLSHGISRLLRPEEVRARLDPKDLRILLYHAIEPNSRDLLIGTKGSGKSTFLTHLLDDGRHQRIENTVNSNPSENSSLRNADSSRRTWLQETWAIVPRDSLVDEVNDLAVRLNNLIASMRQMDPGDPMYSDQDQSLRVVTAKVVAMHAVLVEENMIELAGAEDTLEEVRRFLPETAEQAAAFAGLGALLLFIAQSLDLAN